MSKRLDEIKVWASQQLGEPIEQFLPMVADASTRRYIRIHTETMRYVLMDAEDMLRQNQAFISVRDLLAQQGLRVPTIHHTDLTRGFMLLEDLGDQLLSQVLTADTVDAYYQLALRDLLRLHQTDLSDQVLPSFSKDLFQQEMALFEQWFVTRHLAHQLTASERAVLAQALEHISDVADKQVNVLLHRDYHSRNLLVQPQHLAVIDFQDAIIGPIVYDLVSLVRDCYVDWPEQQVRSWVDQFHGLLTQANLVQVSAAMFHEWFDMVTLQRMIKNVGNFARLHYHYKKPGYMQYYPRMFQYMRQACQAYPVLSDFQALLGSLYESHDSCSWQRSADATADR